MTVQSSRMSPFVNNIVSQAELRHQRYIIKTSRSGWPWIVMAMILLAPGLILSLVLVGFAITENDPNIIYTATNASFSFSFADTLMSLGWVSLLTMNVALYLVIMLITLGLAANSINREKVSRTWEVLLITNIDARQLVWGKWWASIRALWFDHTMLALLRLGLVGVIVADQSSVLPEGPFGMPPGITHMVILGTFVLIFTAMDASVTVVMGLTAPISTLPGTMTGAVVLAARLTGMVFNGVFALAVGTLVIYGEPYQYLWAVLVGVLIGIIVNYVALRIAEAVAIRGQVSPPDDD